MFLGLLYLAITCKIDFKKHFKRRSNSSNNLGREVESENNKQSSKPNFTNFASELLKDCQRDLSETGKKKCFNEKNPPLSH